MMVPRANYLTQFTRSLALCLSDSDGVQGGNTADNPSEDESSSGRVTKTAALSVVMSSKSSWLCREQGENGSWRGGGPSKEGGLVCKEKESGGEKRDVWKQD